MTPDWVTAIAAVATAVITLGAALVALGQLRAAREEQRQVNRPMMIAEYEFPAGGGAPQGISVQNIGRTIAHDVRISFEPPLPGPPPGPTAGQGPGALTASALARTTFGTWAPGQRLRVPLRPPHPADAGAAAPHEGAPGRRRIRIRYRGHDGRGHEETLELDSAIGAGALIGEGEPTRIRRELAGIRAEMRRIARGR
ncbi:hypothetical protein CSPHI_08130 [Corynebacterium sphenisci DSM 44792]|uniref:Uncharacterized protein n=1 Tax=Corynebacterium sphenisci DSM 44792 TaxID=1437874 RepID=A0A1L7CYW0_9CORY|nr:hypothetical protein [Corynebacterium sphenisci]APT91012.1 hypothetical protein CSPHI_08130 [Corynebacterium sphenisci DSM 44792]